MKSDASLVLTTATTTTTTTKPKKPLKFSLKRASVLREPLKNAGPEREACKMCKLWKSGELCEGPRVPDDWTGEIVVVTEGRESGRERSLLRKLWRKAGWTDADVALVPAVRCAGKKEPNMITIRACRPFLIKVLHTLKPRHVLGIGSTALRALRNQGEENLVKNRGRLHEIPGAE